MRREFERLANEDPDPRVCAAAPRALGSLRGRDAPLRCQFSVVGGRRRVKLGLKRDRRGGGAFPVLRRGWTARSNGATCRAADRRRGTTSRPQLACSRDALEPPPATGLPPYRTRALPKAAPEARNPRTPRVGWKLPGPGRLPAPWLVAPDDLRRESLAPTDTASRTTPTRRVTSVDESETSDSSCRAPPYIPRIDPRGAVINQNQHSGF